MKSLEQILDYKGQAMDGRDLSRLVVFYPIDKLTEAGYEVKEEAKENYKPTEFTEEEVLGRLQSDLKFAFEKALNQRGLSSSMMNDVIKMWMWVLEDDLAEHNKYAHYGLPLLKAVAIKYGFENPLGDNNGDESEYSG